ncbi:MAG: DUF6159 family protein [Thermomicrobiales bacterium]
MSRIGETFKRSWQLLGASWAVLMSRPSLLIFPVLAFPAFLAVLALMLGGGIAIFGMSPETADPTTMQIILGVILFAAGIYLLSFTTIFLNTALAGVVLRILRGENPTVSDGFAIARSRLGAIAGYAAISTIVGIIINTIQEKAGAMGGIAGALGGFAWGIATALVMPVLAAENVGPVDAIRRSSGLLKRTFGAQITGAAGLGAAIFLPMLLTGLIGGGLLALGGNTSSQVLSTLGIIVLVGGLGLLTLLALTVGTALQQIFSTAVYHYSADGQPNPYFPDDLLRSAYRAK